MDPVRAAVVALLLAPVAAVYPLARLPWPRVRWLLGVPVCCAALAAPFLLEPDQARRRWKVAMIAFVLWGRGLDYLRRRPAPGARPGGYLRYLLFMTFWPNTMALSRFVRTLHQPRVAFLLRKLGAGTARLAAGMALLTAGAYWRLPETSPVLDHIFKVIEIYLLLCGASNVVVGLLGGLTGRQVDEVIRGMAKTRTILDFWARYNMMVHYWMREHVFERVGGLRRPMLGLFATFAFSGLLHEYIFYVAAPDLLGHQMLFFMLQATAGFTELRVRRRVEVPHWLSRGYTIGFAFLTAPIFFLGLDRIYRFHDSGTARWMLQVLGLA